MELGEKAEARLGYRNVTQMWNSFPAPQPKYPVLELGNADSSVKLKGGCGIQP